MTTVKIGTHFKSLDSSLSKAKTARVLSALDGSPALDIRIWLAPKLALYLALRDQRISNSELERSLGVHERAIRRMLDPAHASKATGIQTALAALGKQLTVEVRDAA